MGIAAVEWTRVIGIIIIVISVIVFGVIYYLKKKSDKNSNIS